MDSFELCWTSSFCRQILSTVSSLVQRSQFVDRLVDTISNNKSDDQLDLMGQLQQCQQSSRAYKVFQKTPQARSPPRSKLVLFRWPTLNQSAISASLCYNTRFVLTRKIAFTEDFNSSKHPSQRPQCSTTAQLTPSRLKGVTSLDLGTQPRSAPTFLTFCDLPVPH